MRKGWGGAEAVVCLRVVGVCMCRILLLCVVLAESERRETERESGSTQADRPTNGRAAAKCASFGAGSVVVTRAPATSVNTHC